MAAFSSSLATLPVTNVCTPPMKISSSTVASSSRPNSTSPTRVKRHKQFYLPDGNIVIQVENTLFRLELAILHEHSPILRGIVPPIVSGSLPIVGYNDKRPLHLREITSADFGRLLSIIHPSESRMSKRPNTVDDYVSILKLARSFQMDTVRAIVTSHLHELSIDPIRKIAIWEEFHLDLDLLRESYIALCQRSEPLTLPMTMTLGIKNFTKVAASRDLYRQRVGCCGCRKSLSVEESNKIAQEVVSVVFGKTAVLDKPML